MMEQYENGRQNNSHVLYLEHIAKRWGKTAKEVLHTLIPHDIIYTPVANVTFVSKSTGIELFQLASDMPVPEPNLQIIYSNGSWKGNTILIKETLDNKPHTTEARLENEITITTDNLFVHEYDLLTLEDKFPELLAGSSDPEASYLESHLLEAYKILNVDPYAATTGLITNNYLLIGVLLEYIIGKHKGLRFTKQSELIKNIIAEYKFSDSDLNKKFPTAKKVKNSIEKLFEEALSHIDDPSNLKS